MAFNTSAVSCWNHRWAVTSRQTALYVIGEWWPAFLLIIFTFRVCRTEHATPVHAQKGLHLHLPAIILYRVVDFCISSDILIVVLIIFQQPEKTKLPGSWVASKVDA